MYGDYRAVVLLDLFFPQGEGGYERDVEMISMDMGRL
jgi:hypothetical protein